VVHRDLLAWLVDVSTIVVGVAAAVALVVTVRASGKEREWNELAWQRQVALDHHARIYGATARAIESVVTFTRQAEARVQARGTAMVDQGYAEDADETIDPQYAAILDGLGGTLSHAQRAHDRALADLDALWFFISPSGDGERLLADLHLVRQAVEAVRPDWGHDAGRGGLYQLVADSGMQDAVELHVGFEATDEERPMARLEFARAMAATYLRAEVGRYVPPPDLGVDPR
jgi:hypothetical protein